MKTLKHNAIHILMLVGFTALTGISCDDKEDESIALSRRFRPALVAATPGETQVKLEWVASQFTVPGEVDYVVEVSRDPASFDNPEFTATTKETTLVITDNELAVRQDYYLRVKAVGATGTEDSRWTIAGPFRILGEQFLLAVPAENVIDRAVRLSWKANAELSKIVITGPSGSPVTVTLTDADKAQLVKQVENLLPSTLYSAEIFAGSKSKGIVQFTTKAGLSGNIIDLRGIPGKASILQDTLPDVASGSVIVLKRSASYTLTSVYAFDKSLSIVSGLDFGGTQPEIKTTSNFNVVAGSAIDSIVFKDIKIKGNRPSGGSYGADYLMNASGAGTIGKIRIQDCTIDALRGIVRAQTGAPGTKITNLFVKNCLVDSVREYGIATASGGSAFANIEISNCTFTRFRKFIDHRVAGNASILIENCTFNQVPAGGAVATTNFFIDFNTANSGGVTIKNCIWGATWDEGSGTLSSGFRAGATTAANVTTSYNTSDFVNNSFAIPGLSAYTQPSTSVFESPSTGNFKVKDSGFPGKNAGDPRWR